MRTLIQQDGLAGVGQEAGDERVRGAVAQEVARVHVGCGHLHARASRDLRRAAHPYGVSEPPRRLASACGRAMPGKRSAPDAASTRRARRAACEPRQRHAAAPPRGARQGRRRERLRQDSGTALAGRLAGTRVRRVYARAASARRRRSRAVRGAGAASGAGAARTGSESGSSQVLSAMQAGATRADLSAYFSATCPPCRRAATRSCVLRMCSAQCAAMHASCGMPTARREAVADDLPELPRSLTCWVRTGARHGDPCRAVMRVST